MIVGFGHKARHGKDTVCQLVHEALPKHTRIMGFADDLKAYARILGMDEKDPVLLQHLGTALRRLDPGVFIRCMASRIRESGAPCILIPDVRYENEAEWITRKGGMLVRVVRTEPNGKRFIDPSRPADHPSEMELEHYTGWGWYIDAPSGGMPILEVEAVRLAKAIAARLGAGVTP